MRIHGENLPAQRIHQNAARNFLPDPRQRQQKGFRILVAHRVQRFQSRLAEPCHDDVEKLADRRCLLVRQAAAGDGPRNIFGRRFGDSQVGGEGFLQRAEGIAVARFASFGAANDEQQFVQRFAEVVVIEVVVAAFQRCGNIKNRQRVFWRGHMYC